MSSANIAPGHAYYESLKSLWSSEDKPGLIRYLNAEYLVNWETSPSEPIFVPVSTYGTAVDHLIDNHYISSSNKGRQ